MAKNKKIIGISIGLAATMLIGVVGYPLLRGNTKEEMQRLETSILNPPQTRSNRRGADYGEFLVVYRNFSTFKAAVYYHDLNQGVMTSEQYMAITPEKVKEETNAFAVKRNGPRFWVVDEITAFQAGEAQQVAGFTFARPGVLEISKSELQERQPYTENPVNRKTEYLIKKGEKVYELINPAGEIYTMQSASKEIQNLTIADLDTLGEKLTLPDGWQYRVRTVEEDTIYMIEKTAYILQDEFQNSYQKNP